MNTTQRTKDPNEAGLALAAMSPAGASVRVA